MEAEVQRRGEHQQQEAGPRLPSEPGLAAAQPHSTATQPQQATLARQRPHLLQQQPFACMTSDIGHHLIVPRAFQPYRPGYGYGLPADICEEEKKELVQEKTCKMQRQ